MTSTWTLAVARNDLARTTLVETTAPELAAGEARLRVDRVGMTANNVTYAVLGDSFHYWDFFPAAAGGLGPEWGLAPLWGFAEVVESTVDGVEEGHRLYGYLPPSSHLVVTPGRVDARGFRDTSAHRAHLPSPYNTYALTTGDSAYEEDREDLLILFRPLFFTSFMLADQLEDNGYYGADAIVLSSASSKTAYGTAFLLRGQGPRVVGLTSPGNVEFTRALGCYDEVVAYPDVARLDPRRSTVYLDVAADDGLRVALREHLGDRLVQDIAVGLTHQTPNAMRAGSVSARSELASPAVANIATQVFFAPDQMRKRAADWGRAGLDERFGEAWRRFASTVEGWVDVVVSHGPEGLREAWLEVLGGRTPPRSGLVIAV